MSSLEIRLLKRVPYLYGIGSTALNAWFILRREDERKGEAYLSLCRSPFVGLKCVVVVSQSDVWL